MTDAELIAFGKAARRMCSPAANLGKPPREPFVIQLREAREEWKRRRTASMAQTERRDPTTSVAGDLESSA